jgi:chromosome segregation ATPase
LKPTARQQQKKVVEVFEDNDIPDREMATLFEELEELHKQNEKISKKYTTQKSGNKKLQDHLDLQTSQIEEYENIIKQLRDQIVVMEEKLSSVSSGEASPNAQSEQKVKSLSQTITTLQNKLKEEQDLKQRMENILKSKESNNVKLKERNDRLEKLVNGDEK